MRTPRLPPEIRRRQILDATRRALDEHGFADLTIDAIAREAGITRPVIYDLFGDLPSLLDAFLDDAEQGALAAVGGAIPDPNLDDPPDRMLAEAVRIFLEAVRAEPEIWRIILLPPEGTPASVRGRVERRRAELTEGVAEVIEIATERHGILAGVDLPSFAAVLIALVEDMGRLVLEKPRRYTPTRIARAAGQIARLLPATGDAAGRSGR